MRILAWLARALVFFVLFAFALNNQHEVTLKWFFGAESRAPMVFIVLAVFALGCALGALAMVPSWWRHRRRAALREATDTPAPVTDAGPASEPLPAHPPREGL